MLKHFLTGAALLLALSGCGGGGADSTVTNITGPGLNASLASAAVSVPFVQRSNNLSVAVEAGPSNGFSLTPNANILYATVKVCVPGDPSQCQTIDHVQVDTGSVGLRVLASKVTQLHLPAVALPSGPVWECYPFVIGGLWGSTAVADVLLGAESARALPIQLIQDDQGAAIQAPLDCANAANGQILSSSSAMGSNGILGIGSVTLDCGLMCLLGNYAGSYVQYYSCPKEAKSAASCTPAAVPANIQVYNPVAAFASDNNGVILTLPAVTGLGASTASGELIFGINTQTNNQLSASASRVRLGVDWHTNPDSYMNVTTRYKGQTIRNSYLDTGTNGLFFTDNSATPTPRCSNSSWYCPTSTQRQTATIADGDNLLPQNTMEVQFNVGNAEALFLTTNAAFGDLAGAPPSASSTVAPSFSWGLPFFYGRRVYLSIWQQAGAVNGPWYAWSSL